MFTSSFLSHSNGFGPSAVCRVQRQKGFGIFSVGRQLFLEADRRSIAQGRMAAPDIIKSLDVFEHSELRFRLRAQATPIEQFTLQRSEERLGHRIVVSIPDRTDGGHDTHFPAALAEREARVLGSRDRNDGSPAHRADAAREPC